MRELNPRGVARNTLSKSVDLHAHEVSGVRDLGKRVWVALGVRARTAVNETETETTRSARADAAAAGVRTAGLP